MDATLQTIIVIAVIAVCALLAIRRGLRSIAGKKTGCGCAECPALKDKPAAPDTTRVDPTRGGHPT
ncbi:MAG: FeoB-associated Cys-rich membrane protein [Planctomycetes bacterium]|nr:FeoB-associated Cys-rich membrane protein [Planctomycetota bacterium]